MAAVTKKLINDPDKLIDELIAGIVSAHPDKVCVEGGTGRAIVAVSGPRDGKVGVVIGGGSGHEPAFACYVGKGLADAAPVGNIFASPSPPHILDAAYAADRGAGVIFLYGNYAGDVMNFDMAADELKGEGIHSRTLLTTDDIASAPLEKIHDRRGIAGNFFVFKVAGAAADLGLDLDAVHAAASHANANTRTMGVALSACSMPQTGKANFEIPAGEMEVGMGIHGEPGVERVAIETADQVTDRLLEPILSELGCSSGGKVAVLVNGLGSTTLLEQYIIHRRVAETLAERGVSIHNSWVGEYCTSLEMAGVSVTLMKLDPQLTEWLDHPCDTPALRVGAQAGHKQDASRPAAAPQTRSTRGTFEQDKSKLIATGDLTPERFKAALARIADDVFAAKDMLGELDGVIGDGDHGVTMEIGWKAILEQLETAPEDATISALCMNCAEAFLNSVGASAGPLYASGFQSAARSVQDRLNLDSEAAARWIAAMSEGIQTRGKATAGDKTMLDAWLPAADAATAAAKRGGDLQTVLTAAAAAAEDGADNTKDMISRKGRSRTLGERSLGHKDPGAASAALILKSFSLAATVS